MVKVKFLGVNWIFSERFFVFVEEKCYAVINGD
jgi:hypothetical protein